VGGAERTSISRKAGFKKTALPGLAGRRFLRHPRMNWHKLISGVFAALFVGVAVVAAAFFLELQRDLTVLRRNEAAQQARLADVRRRLAEQERRLERLRHDPALVEEIIRRKLGYVREGEFVFRFEEPATP